MSNSQKFPVAVHALVALAQARAFEEGHRLSGQRLAASIPTHPVVLRRVTSLLSKAGLTQARAGSGGGVWLIAPPQDILLDRVLAAVGGEASLGAPLAEAGAPPEAARLRAVVGDIMRQAEAAAHAELSTLSIADLAVRAARA